MLWEYLGMYNTLSATTKPTMKTRFVAGRKGTTSSNNPSTSGACLWFWTVNKRFVRCILNTYESHFINASRQDFGQSSPFTFFDVA